MSLYDVVLSALLRPKYPHRAFARLCIRPGARNRAHPAEKAETGAKLLRRPPIPTLAVAHQEEETHGHVQGLFYARTRARALGRVLGWFLTLCFLSFYLISDSTALIFLFLYSSLLSIPHPLRTPRASVCTYATIRYQSSESHTVHA